MVKNIVRFCSVLFGLVLIVVISNAVFGQGFDGGGYRNQQNLPGNSINWSDIRAFGSKYGDHSGVNWAAFGV